MAKEASHQFKKSAKIGSSRKLMKTYRISVQRNYLQILDAKNQFKEVAKIGSKYCRKDILKYQFNRLCE